MNSVADFGRKRAFLFPCGGNFVNKELNGCKEN